jgi:hypothetical protein
MRHRKSWLRLERVVLHALRIHETDHMPHDPALAGRIHPLQDEQHGYSAPGPTLREELLLEGRQSSCSGSEGGGACFLAAVEPWGGSRVHGGEGEIRPRHQQGPLVFRGLVGGFRHGSSCCQERVGRQGL